MNHDIAVLSEKRSCDLKGVLTSIHSH